MQNFVTLAAFFLVEKQWPRREEKKMPSTMVTTSSAQRRSDQFVSLSEAPSTAGKTLDKIINIDVCFLHLHLGCLEFRIKF